MDFYHANFTAGGTLTIIGDGSDAGPKASFDINILADNIDEWNEKIQIDLGTPSNADASESPQHIVTITDASDAPTINFSTTSIDDGTAETTQANNDYTLDIDLSIQSGKNLKFSYSTLTNPGTATPGQDFEALIGEFVITAGNTTPPSDIILIFF